MAQLPSLSFLDPEAKAALNNLHLRLNDIDVKLSIVLELLATRLPDQRSLPKTCPSHGTYLQTHLNFLISHADHRLRDGRREQ